MREKYRVEGEEVRADTRSLRRGEEVSRGDEVEGEERRKKRSQYLKRCAIKHLFILTGLLGVVLTYHYGSG